MTPTIVAVKVRMACQVAHKIHPSLHHTEAYFHPVVAREFNVHLQTAEITSLRAAASALNSERSVERQFGEPSLVIPDE